MSEKRPGVVSVILVNYKGTADTLTCIEELTRTDWDPDRLEIIVIDNDSGEDLAAPLRASALPFRLVETGANLGFTGGCNRGAEEATGEYIAFLNNDARPDRSWIRAAMETFGREPDVGAVASKVLDWDGADVDFTEAALTWYGMGYKPFAGTPDDGRWNTERDVLFGTGAAMFIKAELFDELEGFDDRYFMFYDDVDLGWRLNLLGWRFRYQPASLAFHKHHASMKAFGPFRETYLLERNAIFTLFKNLGDEELSRVLPAALTLAVRRSVARADIDSTQLDLRRPGGDGVGTIPVAKIGMAGVFAVDQFAEMLPSLAESRAHIQRTRARSDRDLRALFGVMDEPAYPIEDYLDGYARIMSALDPAPSADRRSVTITAGATDTPESARTALIAAQLARIAEVEVRPKDVPLLVSSSSTIHIVSVGNLGDAEVMYNANDAVVVLDAGSEAERSRFATDNLSNDVRALINRTDLFLTESEAGRRWWLELLIATGRLHPALAHDASRIISVIPAPSEQSRGEAGDAWAAMVCADVVRFVEHPTVSRSLAFAPSPPAERPRRTYGQPNATTGRNVRGIVRRVVRRAVPIGVRVRIAGLRRRMR